MSGIYLGVLQEDDQLYPYLAYEVLGQILGHSCHRPVFDVFRLGENSSNWSIFRYAERHTGVNLVGKFYGDKWLGGREVGNFALRSGLMWREFDNLHRLRALGFDAPPYRVARPIATSERINCALIEEFVFGRNLDDLIGAAIADGQEERLLGPLGDVAGFLAALHSRAPQDAQIDPSGTIGRLGDALAGLAQHPIAGPDQMRRLGELHARRSAELGPSEGPLALIHGDARPAHFLFTGEGETTAIDLEHLRHGDCAEDIGKMAGEMRHLFLWHGSSPQAAAPLARHFIDQYLQRLTAPAPDRDALLARVRIYTACVGLAIGQISWMDPAHRRAIVADA